LKIAVMSAMHEENASIVNDMHIDSEETIGGRTYFSGQLCDKNIVVVFSHWGKVAASITATTLITKFAIDEIIFTGVAGGISDTLSIGDIVIGKNLFQHDMDARPIIEQHEIPLLGRAAIGTCPTIQKKLTTATKQFLEIDLNQTVSNNAKSQFNIEQPIATVADIASGDQFISDSALAADILRRLPDVACIEMEGAAVAQVCEAFDVPFGLVRTISDCANEKSDIDFPGFISLVAQSYSLGIVKRYLIT